jgi:hypothetical protein
MQGQTVKKHIYKILKLMNIDKSDITPLGSFDNPDFKYFGDVDIDFTVKLDQYLPKKIKKLLETIKKYQDKYGFKFLEMKLGIDKTQYFRSERKEDYERRFNKKFEDMSDARQYAKSRYTTKITSLNTSLEEIKDKLKNPGIIKLDLLIYGNPNITADIVYKYETKSASPTIILIKDILDDLETQKKNNKWSKVIKRLYSIAKITGDEVKQKSLANIYSPYEKDLWLTNTLDIPQSPKWIEFVKSENIDVNKIQSELKEKISSKFLI